MIRPRSLATFVVVNAALTSSTTSAFSPSLHSAVSINDKLSSVDLPTRRQQPLLHVGTTLPHQPEHFGSSFEDEISSSNHHHDHSSTSMPQGVHAPITAINSPQELADFLNLDDRICVIKFHAAWCKSCQRFGHKFQGLANQKTDWVDSATSNVVEEGPMRFGSIEFGANMGMCRTLQIKRLPTVHFYQKGQKLDGFPCGPSKFPMLLEKVEQYLQHSGDAASLEEILQQGDELMSSSEVAGVLEHLITQEANGSLESSKTAKSSRQNKKWWNIMP